MPDYLAVEEPKDLLNAKTSRVLIGYYSMLHLAAFQLDTPVITIAPSEMKKKIAGNGRAGKDEVCKALSGLLNVPVSSLELPIYSKRERAGHKKGDLIDIEYDKSDACALAWMGWQKALIGNIKSNTFEMDV
jgi:hypothetical protein